ncbi:MAG: hypothetical protein CMQ53_04940 [Gammaproteobacteria bacterium]|nr:hypothetical protein [Gammaproteobacteria bacterium]|tara:strand:+ start:4752 stop:5549 length:798 start_codon:yes stop_codon:yes gene_type:complete
MDISNNIINSIDDYNQVPENFLLSPITPIANTNPQNRINRINQLLTMIDLLTNNNTVVDNNINDSNEDASNNIINNTNNFFNFLMGRNHSTFNGLNSVNNILNNTLNQGNIYKKVVSDEGLNEIIFDKYSAEKYPETKTCVITQKDFQENDDIAILPCKHIFDKDAILYWLKNQQAKCPVCRRELKYKEVKKTDENKDISQNPMNDNSNNVIPRRTRRIPAQNPLDIFRNIIEERERKAEEEMMQQAILESLAMSNQIIDTSNNL